MALYVIPFGVFLFTAAVIVGLYYAVVKLPGELAKRRIENRLNEVQFGAEPEASDQPQLVKRAAEGPLPGLDRFASRTSGGAGLARLIEQAGMKVSVSLVLLISIFLGIVCALVASATIRLLVAPIAGALLGMAAPFIFLRHRKSTRLKKFEEQFPEALDLLSRAIRAGHAFTTAMGMVADEALDPVGPEFKKTFDQQNFGLPLKDALNQMTERIPLLDVRFFVTAVLIQRETGGNLSEILDNLAHVVRERFKILRQVRVYTAHGRMTGYVLMALPAALAIALSFINPEHINLLFTERMGQMMVGGAIVMQIVGYLWIKQVIKIEV
jgi:tight adherence protein B